ncbi:hypothetical protein [Brasilonema octagenarum]|uniref:hypothetical protein n=1 Tax=Brasilonema octagenarum TaxID=417105 RepID=UPI00145D4C1A|nr:hypothetical protein [Brasilonema octagenarum]
MNSMFELRFPTFALFTYKVVRLCQVVGRHQCCLTRTSNCYGHLYATTPVLTIPDTLKNMRYILKGPTSYFSRYPSPLHGGWGIPPNCVKTAPKIVLPPEVTTKSVMKAIFNALINLIDSTQHQPSA